MQRAQGLPGPEVAEGAKSAVLLIECLATGDDHDRVAVGGSKITETRWKSLLSGKEKILRLDGEHLYVETVLSEQAKRDGVVVMAELKKQGDKYVGTSRDYFPCRYPDLWKGWNDPHTNRCNRAMSIELQFVSPSRIEGKVQQMPEGNKFNCKVCTDSKEAVFESSRGCLNRSPEVETCWAIVGSYRRDSYKPNFHEVRWFR